MEDDVNTYFDAIRDVLVRDGLPRQTATHGLLNGYCKQEEIQMAVDDLNNFLRGHSRGAERLNCTIVIHGVNGEYEISL